MSTTCRSCWFERLIYYISSLEEGSIGGIVDQMPMGVNQEGRDLEIAVWIGLPLVEWPTLKCPVSEYSGVLKEADDMLLCSYE